ncbi:MAG TPA: MazG-like family protein [Patescibacteria group bacterium]
MNQEDIFDLNLARIKRFEKIEGRPWGVEGAIIELTKQVGELAALVMTKEGYYFKNREQYSDKYSQNTDDIADELADITYAVTRIAKHYNIDVLKSTQKAAQEDERWFKDKGISF